MVSFPHDKFQPEKEKNPKFTGNEPETFFANPSETEKEVLDRCNNNRGIN